MPIELTPSQFDSKFSPIFEHVSAETGIEFDPDHFFPVWKSLMSSGIARTWENDGCILGALFAPDVFNGAIRALVHFWFSLPEARGTGRPKELLDVFESAASAGNCKNISIASHVIASPHHLQEFFHRRGYSRSEIVFSKQLHL